MNTYERMTAVQISEQLHICIVKALDAALTARAGADWFDNFKAYDNEQDIHILDKSHTSVNRMDFQACLKFLRYRDQYSKMVFEYFGYDFYEDTDDSRKALLLLNQRLDNLIHNVRNYLFAHASATLVKEGKDYSTRYSVYGADEAVVDMLKLASFFSEMTDEDGVSYYTKMLKMTEPSKSFAITDTIAKEKLKTDVGGFVIACNSLNIPIVTAFGGKINFLTSNYQGDVARIKIQLEESYKSRTKKIPVIILTAVLAVLVCITVILAVTLKNKNDIVTDENTNGFQNGQEYTAYTEPLSENKGNALNSSSEYEPVVFEITGYQWKDNRLVVNLEIENTLTYAVDKIMVYLRIEDNTGAIIAGQIFILEDFTLQAGECKPYTCEFDEDKIEIRNVELTNNITWIKDIDHEKADN